MLMPRRISDRSGALAVQFLLEQVRLLRLRRRGELTKLIGDEAHPNAQGKLCARGYGYSQIAYSPDRLTDPMKKNENGEFEVIGWDQRSARSARR